MSTAVIENPTDTVELTPDLWEKLGRAETHDLRLRILGELVNNPEPQSPRGLSDLFGVPLGNVSYHVGELVSFGLVVLDRTEPRRGAVEHFYALAEAVS